MNRPCHALQNCTIIWIEKARDEKKGLDFLKYKVNYPCAKTGEPCEIVISNKTGQNGAKIGDKINVLVTMGATTNGSLWYALDSFTNVEKAQK